jgi:hypothetical protein
MAEMVCGRNVLWPNRSVDETSRKYTTDTPRSASYLDLHLKIENRGRLSTKLYDKRDDFTFPIVNFPFLCGNIPPAPVYWVYISQLVRYSRACGVYCDFLDRAQLLTDKLMRQGYVAKRLKSSLLKFLWFRDSHLLCMFLVFVLSFCLCLCSSARFFRFLGLTALDYPFGTEVRFLTSF